MSATALKDKNQGSTLYKGAGFKRTLHSLCWSICYQFHRSLLTLFQTYAQPTRVARWLEKERDDDLRLKAPSARYRRFLDAEIRYWQNPPHGDEAQIHSNYCHPELAPNLLSYTQTLRTGKSNCSLVELLKSEGPFEEVLSLAHFPELNKCIQEGIGKTWTFNNITGRYSVNTADDASIIQEEQDLNFPVFKENSYDLIIADSVLHHIINVEQLLINLNRALKPGGILLIPFDYIGEERFVWNENKRLLANTFLSELPLKYLRFPYCPIEAIYYSELSPFEAVSSREIPKLLSEIFEEVDSRTGAGMLFPVMYYFREEYLRSDNPALSKLIEADKHCSELGVQPALLSGMYRKKC